MYLHPGNFNNINAQNYPANLYEQTESKLSKVNSAAFIPIYLISLNSQNASLHDSDFRLPTNNQIPKKLNSCQTYYQTFSVHTQ